MITSNDQGKTLTPSDSRRRVRSQKTVEALVAAAREMLVEKSFHELSVVDLCASIGMTTGAFYNAFKGKGEFFKALQQQACAERMKDMDGLLRAIDNEHLSLEDICLRLVRQIVVNARKDTGILRASLLPDRTGEDLWAPFREMGARYKNALVLHLVPHLQALPAKQRDLRVRFANQAIAALVVHTVLNRPGPLDIADEAFIVQTSRMVFNYLVSK